MSANDCLGIFDIKNEDNVITFTVSDYVWADHSAIEEMLPLDIPMMFNGICLGICREGATNVKVGNKIYRITPEILLVLPLRQVLTALSRDNGFQMDILFIPALYLEDVLQHKELELFSYVWNMPCIEPGEDVVRDLRNLFDIGRRLFESKVENDFYKDIKVRDIVLSIIHIVSSYYGMYQLEHPDPMMKRSSRYGELASRFFMLMNKSYMRCRELSYYADALCVSPKHLSAVVSDMTNRSASEWIKFTLLTDIKQKLRNTDISIAELSEMMNFSSPSAFSRYFRANFGITPLEYRNGTKELSENFSFR